MITQPLEKQRFASRLKLAIEAKGLKFSPTVICNLFNASFGGKPITPHSARNWLLGVAIPVQDKLVCLAKILDTSPEQLRFGRSAEKTMVFSDGKSEEEVSSSDQQFFQRYLALDDSRKFLMREVMAQFAKSS